jgi:carbamate kinase
MKKLAMKIIKALVQVAQIVIVEIGGGIVILHHSSIAGPS